MSEPETAAPPMGFRTPGHEAPADAVTSRVEGEWTVYSAAGVDLVKRSAKSPERYTVLHDFPRYGLAVGDVKALSAPDEVHLLTTARELAAAL